MIEHAAWFLFGCVFGALAMFAFVQWAAHYVKRR